MKLPSKNTHNAKNMSGDKELTGAWSVVVITRNGPQEAVTVRTWTARANSASTVYASLWARNDATEIAGHGRAGGGGYCRNSAAIDSAFTSAGLTGFETFSGVGIPAAESAMVDLARALGYHGKYTIVRHG